MLNKYHIPKSTLYYILKEEKKGEIPWFHEWLLKDNEKILSLDEKNFLIESLNPPTYPLTINKLNQALNNEFGERNRSKII